MAGWRVVPVWRSIMARRSIKAVGSMQTASSSLRRFSSLGDDLERAKERLNILTEDPGNDAKLKLYGLYKQATIGKCNIKQPGVFDLVGRAKWNAWSSLGEMGKEEAVKGYVQFVEKLVGSVESKAEKADTTDGPPSESSGDVVITNKDGVFTIRLNRPEKKNALLSEMYDGISSALEAAAKDTSVRVVVTTGTGDYYCSGNDLSNFMRISPTPENIKKSAEEAEIRLLKFVDSFINFPKPIVAAVNGPAVGISVTILALYDFVYAADRATFHTPFTQIAQSPEGCSSYLFPRIMGNAKASEMLMLNRKLTSHEACERNLVTQVFPDSEFDQKVAEVVKYMTSLPPQSFQSSKVLMRRANRQILHEVNVRECADLKERWTHEELIQAITAFFNRKKPSKL